MFNWPKTLLRGLAYENLTVVFGAGIPYEFGFPLWGQLIDKIISELDNKLNDDEKKELEEYTKTKDYLNAIELLMYKDKESTIDLLENTFRYDSFTEYNLEDSNGHLLFSLNANSYITTNIDNSLEEVKGLSGKRAANIYSYKNEKDIRDKLIFHNSERDPLIVRIHGELKDHSSLIFSQTQYTDLNKEDLFVFTQLLPSLFLTSIVIIAGYSISDPDIQLILERSSIVKGNKDNIFFINADPKQTPHQKRMFSKRFGIRVLDVYTTEKNNITESLKIALKELVSLKEIIKHYDAAEKRELFKCGDKSIQAKLSKELELKSE